MKDDVWVFGYASLMWNPGFDFVDRQPARLFGYHRALCIYSFLYRGTSEKPGLVAGLLPGGSCKGIAYRVASQDWEQVHQILDDREMVYDVYIPKWLQADINGRRQPVFGYIANPENAQYAANLTLAETTKLVRQGVGNSGTGIEYLENTLTHLAKLGIRDQKLLQLMAAVNKAA